MFKELEAKTGLIILILTLGVAISGSPARATSYQVTPDTTRLQDLGHAFYFAWGIDCNSENLSIPENETIDSATLTISQINNWKLEYNDVLHIWLVDELPDVKWKQKNWPGVSAGKDDRYDTNDAFADSGGTFLMNYSDPDETVPEDLIVDVPLDILREYMDNDGLFGFALDPDCHYYNLGIYLDINTYGNPLTSQGHAPEPLTMVGVCVGLGSLAGYVRKRKRKGN